jgi:hypothetical protein
MVGRKTRCAARMANRRDFPAPVLSRVVSLASPKTWCTVYPLTKASPKQSFHLIRIRDQGFSNTEVKCLYSCPLACIHGSVRTRYRFISRAFAVKKGWHLFSD